MPYLGKQGRPVESSGQGQDLGNVFATIYNDLQKVFSDMDEKTIKNDAIAILSVVVGTSTALSLIPFESNFGSFAAGQIIAEAMKPFVHKIISQPAEEWLNRAFRFSPLPERTALTLVADGILTDKDIQTISIENGFKDKYIPVLQRYAAYKRGLKQLELANAADDEQNSILFFQAQTLVARAETLANRLEIELDALEENEATLILQHQISDLTSKHTRLGTAIHNFEFGTPATAGRALKEMLSIMVSITP